MMPGSNDGISAIIFDMDGLMVDTEPMWRASEIEVFGKVGLKLTEADCYQTTGLRIDEVGKKITPCLYKSEMLGVRVLV
eukprot:m.254263 g.254263  ORF g.254263 m.254263 type:complete len:79 (-) comp16170_c0_seq1:603-839(-)